MNMPTMIIATRRSCRALGSSASVVEMTFDDDDAGDEHRRASNDGSQKPNAEVA
jgi:hypothetical protein